MKNSIIYFFVRSGVYLFWLIPFPVLYIISDLLAFLFQHILQYRKKEIRQNISRAFPINTQSENKKLIDSIYKNLSDILLEGLKGLSMTREQLRKRYSFINAELVDNLSAIHTSVIITGAHIGNWEWAVISLNDWIEPRAIGIFKPVSNKQVENYLNKKRNKLGTELIPTEKSRLAFENGNKDPSAFLLWGDQSPSNAKNAHWIPIFGIDTAWTHGADSIARQHGFPVVYCDTIRLKRGYYRNTFYLLSEFPMETFPAEITKLYVEKVEQSILENPGNWLWTHRRWKHSKV